ncbi:MAG: hypothetical protein ACYDBT_11490 [Desulfobulbaceae bacterium]
MKLLQVLRRLFCTEEILAPAELQQCTEMAAEMEEVLDLGRTCGTAFIWGSCSADGLVEKIMVACREAGLR